MAKRLRVYSQRCRNSITIPDFFSNRYRDDKHVLMGIAAVIILIFFVPYTASGFSACGKLFDQLFGWNYHMAMIISAVIIISYTCLGGFLAASFTDLTMLYKDFAEDGVEVSGGEAQKIAIARALYKDAPFIILDEPTAALDPIAEAEIYEKFNAISGDRTAIYISHRLSSCRFCDEIAVFSDGQVIQQGTHQALLAQESGKYAELWHAQAQYYTKQTPDTDGTEN